MYRFRGAGLAATVGVTFTLAGCALGNDARSSSGEVADALKTSGVANVSVEACEFQKDPEESDFSLYQCTLVVGDDGAVLPLNQDRLPPGRSTYCFNIPRLPHGVSTDPVDVDAYPAWFPTEGSCAG
jgi:hypothetical protein